MCITVLACPKTTLDFMQSLGTSADRTLQATHQSDAQLQVEMFELFEAQSVKLYILPHMVPFLHSHLRHSLGVSISTEGMKQLLQISCSNLPVDYDVLLDESLSFASGHSEFEVWETLCLLIAESLNVDFFLVHNHNYECFTRMSEHQRSREQGQKVPIVSLEELLNRFRA
jgi:hypothetical protein